MCAWQVWVTHLCTSFVQLFDAGSRFAFFSHIGIHVRCAFDNINILAIIFISLMLCAALYKACYCRLLMHLFWSCPSFTCLPNQKKRLFSICKVRTTVTMLRPIRLGMYSASCASAFLPEALHTTQQWVKYRWWSVCFSSFHWRLALFTFYHEECNLKQLREFFLVTLEALLFTHN